MIGARFSRSSCTVPLAAKSGAFTSVVTCPRTFPASDCTSRSSARLSAGPDALTSNFGWRPYSAAAGNTRPISGSETLPVVVTFSTGVFRYCSTTPSMVRLLSAVRIVIFST